jgi:predicted AlkP superfamily phosphohydrolase/phosphomutase
VIGQLGAGVTVRHLLARVAHRLPWATPDPLSLAWMPAAHYARFWPRMRAFALPSFYDGRIRINLEGRERSGLVRIEDYGRVCDEIEELLRACRDPISGVEAVAAIDRNPRPPLEIEPSEVDLMVTWKDPLGLAHPRLGQIGPLPYRRTGGHTGGDGFAWIMGPGVGAGDGGTRSAFDVVPTVIELLDQPELPISGQSFAGLMASAKREPILA